MIEDAIRYPARGNHTGSVVLRGGGVSLLVSLLGTLATVLLLGAFVVELLDLAYGVSVVSRLSEFSTMAAAAGAVAGLAAVLVQMVVTGYYVRVVRSTTEGRSEIPPFDRLSRAFVDGVATTLILAVYALPFLLLAGGGFALGVVEVDAVASAGTAVTVLAVAVVLVLTFVFPAALTNYAATGSVLSGFAPGPLLGFLLSREYVVAWAAGLVIWGVGLAVASLLGGVLPVIGTVFVPFLGFVAGIPAYRLLGLAYNETADAAPR